MSVDRHTKLTAHEQEIAQYCIDAGQLQAFELMAEAMDNGMFRSVEEIRTTLDKMILELRYNLG